MRFEPVIALPTAWTSAYSRFAVHLFEGQVTLADMDKMQAIGERWSQKHPGKRVELVVIYPSDSRMSHEERVRMGRLIKHGEEHRTASATVILAQGLLASMQRSVLTGMTMLVPPPHPMKVFGAVSEAVTWLFPQVRALCGRSVQLDELQGAVLTHMTQFQVRADRPANLLSAT
jgi:hypothetical protein